MTVYFFVPDVLFKVLPDELDVACDLFDEELCALLRGRLLPIELYDGRIIEVTYLFKAGLEYILPDVFVDFSKGLELPQNLRTNGVNIEFIVVFPKKVSIDRAKSHDKQVFNQQYFGVTDFILKFFHVLFLNDFAHALILACQLGVHFLKETILDALNFIAGSQHQLNVFPFADRLVGQLRDVLEEILEEAEVLFQDLFVNGHFMEVIEDQSDVHMELPIAVVGVEERVHFLKLLAISC